MSEGSLFLKLLNWRWWFGFQRKELSQEPPEMRVAVVVPAYNEAENIAATIKSLQEQTYPLSQIIVVDDCSSDNTGEIAKSLGATVIRPDKNQGTKAQAQNCALPYITAELFMTVDADTIVAPNGVYEAMKGSTIYRLRWFTAQSFPRKLKHSGSMVGSLNISMRGQF